MDIETIANAAGVIVVSFSGWLTARSARKAKNASKAAVEESKEEVVPKLDILIQTINRIDHRLIRTETSLNEHIEWHLKEGVNRHG